MNREVSCTVVNNTGYALTYLADCYENGEPGSSHGVWVNKVPPVSKIDSGGTPTLAFAVKKDDGFDGSTGWVTYNLNNGQGQIVFMFNNPYSYDGAGSNGNCWFYAVIQGCTAGATDASVGLPVGENLNVYATVSGFDFNVTDPYNEDTMTVTVTINSII